MYLQKGLSLLRVDDPFLIRNSEDAIAFLSTNSKQGVTAFSIGIKELYYSLPHAELVTCVEAEIDSYRVVPFQNEIGVAARGFLSLLSEYLVSTFAK